MAVASRGGKASPKRERRRRAARRTLSVLPTLCTLGNVLCGFASVFFASRNPAASAGLPWGWTPLTFAAIFIFLGMVMDGLDGRIARLTRNTSDLGEQLDSMADMVTFGVAPAFLAVQLIGIQPFLIQDQLFDRVVFVIAAIYVCCAALRLARFNTEVDLPTEESHGSFKGLPSPGAAGTVASLVLLHEHFLRHLETANPNHWTTQFSAAGMVLIMLLAAFAMVSRLRYPHLAERYLRGRVRLGTLATFFLMLLMLLVRPQETLAAGFAIYAAWTPLASMLRRLTGRPAPAAAPAVRMENMEPPRRTGSQN